VKDLDGKGIIVTGATRGIGRAIALEAARHGANIAFNFLKSEQRAEELKREIETLGVKVMAFRTDVGDLKAVREMVNAVKSGFGRIDGLVNNAGLTRDKLLVMMSEEDWSEVIRTNLTGAFNFARAAAFMMMKAMAKELGRLGVRVNALALGFVETDMTAALPAENRAAALNLIPLGRFGTVEDVAPVAAFLLSDAAAYITGAVIQVDGGLAM